MSTPTRKDEVQGEGDRAAGRRYDKAAREFAESGKVEPVAHDAAPADAEEAAELRRAENDGKSRSRGEGSFVGKREASGARRRTGAGTAARVNAPRSTGPTPAAERASTSGCAPRRGLHRWW
jgi:hypothetical protein